MKHLPDIYPQLLASIKTAIQAERSRAIQQLTRSLILVYWEIGRLIVHNLENGKWGKGIVKQLSKDLQKEFPGKTGFSIRNLQLMRQFYETYNNYANAKQLVSQIPWGIISVRQKSRGHSGVGMGENLAGIGTATAEVVGTKPIKHFAPLQNAQLFSILVVP